MKAILMDQFIDGSNLYTYIGRHLQILENENKKETAVEKEEICLIFILLGKIAPPPPGSSPHPFPPIYKETSEKKVVSENSSNNPPPKLKIASHLLEKVKNKKPILDLPKLFHFQQALQALQNIGEYFVANTWKNSFGYLSSFKFLFVSPHDLQNTLQEYQFSDLYLLLNEKNLLNPPSTTKSTLFISSDDFLDNPQRLLKYDCLECPTFRIMEKIKECLPEHPSVVYKEWIPMFRPMMDKFLQLDLQEIRKNHNITSPKIMFVHCNNDNQYYLDKLYMALEELKDEARLKEDWTVIVYYPNMTLLGAKLVYDKEKIKITKPLKIHQYKTEISAEKIKDEFQLEIKQNYCNFYLMNFYVEKFGNLFQKCCMIPNYHLNIYEWIRISDIYISLSHEFSDLSIASQILQTYTLTVQNDSLHQEYAFFGKCLPSLEVKDEYFNIYTQRIRPLLTTQDVKSALSDFFTHQEDSRWNYRKEMTSYLL